jgi:hypothetical protein
MRRSLIAILGSVILSSAAFAAPAKTPSAWSSGVIEKFDSAAHSLVVKQGSHQMTFIVSPTAQILEGKSTLTPDTLASNVGHHIKVHYTMANATRVADRVEVTAATPSQTSKPPANHHSK